MAKPQLLCSKKMQILELTAPFVTPRHVALPARDAYGVPHGRRYVPLRDAADISWATRASFNAIKFRRTHQALSLNEMRPLFAFGFNPYVVDIRDQYPVYDQEDYNRAKRRGKRMPISAVQTYDIVLTLTLPPDNRLHYHGVSIKDARDQLTEQDWKRQEREREQSAKRGWTWELLRGDQFSKLMWGNHALMRTWIVNIDVWEAYDEALVLAERVKTHSQNGTLDSILSRHSRCLQMPINRAFELFAIANCFGFLRLDPSHPLRVDHPLHLLDT
ncbi:MULTISPECIES: TnsA endonuclease N-terminal domain-containing protein [Ralstonia]|uniref:TnsA endonuclease N-terminal domain-containing protein n=1 Tax=Ralstonia holmesii TaxID=3058602 RepID=A0ABC8Q7Z6_9RALS|nr:MULTISPECIES: TnsA endonuclease N-terminal domain-containing protein [unclassified Ralstonia]CAJ0781377.1 hypothetical protein LMG18096_01161 [Ralstonia sp. LMG 32967]CAJ0811187.1 hypothetical protein LMG18093_01270 [Ralstonia sp. LMG 32967]